MRLLWFWHVARKLHVVGTDGSQSFLLLLIVPEMVPKIRKMFQLNFLEIIPNESFSNSLFPMERPLSLSYGPKRSRSRNWFLHYEVKLLRVSSHPKRQFIGIVFLFASVQARSGIPNFGLNQLGCRILETPIAYEKSEILV